MSGATGPGLLAIDVGTSRVKLGWFPDAVACDSEKSSRLPIAAPRLPEPAETFAFAHGEAASTVTDWLQRVTGDGSRVVVASVNDAAAKQVEQLLAERGFGAPQVLQTTDLPIELNVGEPARLGIDRALAAVAVNRVRTSGTPAIVVSLGTACTVNLVSAEGVFQGGAILPGLAMAANALHQGTASLPLITPEGFTLPANAVGKSTAEAMSAGIFWGMVGAIERLITALSRDEQRQPHLFLTGGDAPLVVEALEASGHRPRLMPHLVLSGIAIACEAKP
jgi:type III pantothenate kinase